MSEPTDLPRVLAIDDEHDNLSTLRRVFRKEYALTLAQSVDEALRLLQQEIFDVALVDYAMPGADGVEFLKRAREIQPSLESVMVTAHGELDAVRAAHRAGLCKAIVVKPWEAADIRRWVEQILRMRKLRDSVGKMKRTVSDEEG